MHPALISTLSKYNTIILVGGGTGGHIQPIVSIVKSLEHEYLWIGGENSTEAKAAGENNISFLSIPTLKLVTTRSFKVLLYPYFLVLGFLKARKLLKKIKNDKRELCVFSKGGPGSVAIGIAAWSLNIPLYIHESDTVAGRSNQILGKFATKIFLGFENARKYFMGDKCKVTGQILDPIFTKIKGTSELNQPTIIWKTKKPHILVICGSQGSQSIFQAIINQYSNTIQYEWIIALGKLNQDMQSSFDTIPDCQAITWISQSDIAHLISDTDVAISRGSATTLAELTAFDSNKPYLIIIPLPYSAGDHQYFNALEYEKLGHTMLEQKNLTSLNNILTTHFTTICPKQTQK